MRLIPLLTTTFLISLATPAFAQLNVGANVNSNVGANVPGGPNLGANVIAHPEVNADAASLAAHRNANAGINGNAQVYSAQQWNDRREYERERDRERTRDRDRDRNDRARSERGEHDDDFTVNNPNLTPAQQEALRAQREQDRLNWQNLSPAQRGATEAQNNSTGTALSDEQRRAMRYDTPNQYDRARYNAQIRTDVRTDDDGRHNGRLNIHRHRN